ncbi:MAG: galactokinase [Vezdaea aestivalis]|nr:MAG: galactokinase [Vezdaea aestivalis]
MADTVPTTHTLSEIYPADILPSQELRWKTLLSSFESTFNRPAAFISRSPGRVNLIGEHIDYSLYPVLPMAITADVLLVVSPTPSTPSISLSNTLPNFPPLTFPLSPLAEIDASTHHWTNYFKAGLLGALQLLREKRGEAFEAVGMQVLMDGNVPAGSGLSSSAAFVCASALAVLRVNGELGVSKKELVELAVVSERKVGVNSGGMDQAASILSLPNSATHVSFSPTLHAEPIAFPSTDQPPTFLIAQSFVAADKHVTGPVNYNLRVVECTLAAVLLAKKLQLGELEPDSSPLGVSLMGLHRAYFAKKANSKTYTPPTDPTTFRAEIAELLTLTSKTLSPDANYTRSDLCQLLSLSDSALEARYMSSFPVRSTTFKLRQRATHVLSEALRVQDFLSHFRSPALPGSESLLSSLGELMNQSQRSCKELFECSCAELDRLCGIARREGAVGSRLTGAGWGGCSVHLVPVGKVEAVKEGWKGGFYEGLGLEKGQLEEAIVESRAGGGSCVFEIPGEGGGIA